MHKPHVQNTRFHTGNPDPILTPVAMALAQAGLSARRGDVAMARTLAFCYSLARAQRACFPPAFSRHPSTAGSSPHLQARSPSWLPRSSPLWGAVFTGLLLVTWGWCPAGHSSRPLAACPYAGKAFIFLLFLAARSPPPSLAAFQPSREPLYSFRKGDLWQYF